MTYMDVEQQINRRRENMINKKWGQALLGAGETAAAAAEAGSTGAGRESRGGARRGRRGRGRSRPCVGEGRAGEA
jgi:hypothetical protein